MIAMLTRMRDYCKLANGIATKNEMKIKFFSQK